MSNFLKMFRSKKTDKENDSPVEEDRKPIYKTGSAYSSTRKDRRLSVAIASDDTFVKPANPYHTVTQPKQTRGTRSCVGKDEYERYVQSRPSAFRDHSFKSGSNFGKRKAYEPKVNTEFSVKTANFDDELFDSDDSFASEENRRATRYRNEVVRDLKEEVEYLKYRLRREVEKKLAYKEKLICEQNYVQKLLHQRQRMEYDVNIYKNLLANHKNERKVQQAKIAKLEAELKTRNVMQRSFGNGTLTTPTSTSNELSSIDEPIIDLNSGAGEMLCSASDSTFPNQTAFDSITDSMDEVKNFRKDDTNASFELARAEAESGVEKIDLDSTLLNDTETEQSSNDNETTLKAKSNVKKPFLRPSSLRRSSSDTDVRKKRRSVAFKMTNL